MCPQSCHSHNRHNFLNYHKRVRRPAILLRPPLIFYDALWRSHSDRWRVTYMKWQVTQYESASYIRQMLIKRCSLIVPFDWMRYCVCFLSTQDCKKSCCGQILTPRQEVNCGNFRLSAGNNINHVLHPILIISINAYLWLWLGSISIQGVNPHHVYALIARNA